MKKSSLSLCFLLLSTLGISANEGEKTLLPVKEQAPSPALTPKATAPTLKAANPNPVVFPPSPAEVEAAMKGGSSTPEKEKEEGSSNFFYQETTTAPASSLHLLSTPSEESSAWTGRVSVGYESNYHYKNLILSSRYCKNGVIASQLGGDYALENGAHLSVDYFYDEILAGKFSEKNGHQFTLAYKEEYLPDFYLEAGYNLFHGGLPGLLAKNLSHKRHALTQEFELGAELVFASGFYTRLTSVYSFQGLTGWWFNVEGGYRYEVNDFTLLTLSSYTSTSVGYLNTNGANQIGLKAQFDYTINEQWSVRSFMATEWMLHTALNINHAAGSSVFRPFTFFVGKSVTYTF